MGCSKDFPATEVARGVRYYDCSGTTPVAAHVVTIDRNIPGMEMRILADPIDQSKEFRLKQLPAFAQQANAVVAINGMYWGPDNVSGYDCDDGSCRGVPDTTVYIDGQQRSVLNLDGETYMAFGRNVGGAIPVQRIPRDQLQLPANDPFRYHLYGATMIMANKALELPREPRRYRQSIVGYSPDQIVLFVTEGPYYVRDLHPLLDAFGITDAVQNDGGPSAHLFVGGPLNQDFAPPPVQFRPNSDKRSVAYGLGLVPTNVNPPGPVQPPTPPTECAALLPGQGLVRGQSVRSCDGRFELTMQSDGNLVLYRIGAGALWATDTAGTAGEFVIMQTDGNLVLYGAGEALWATNTHGFEGAYARVQDDGNFVLHEANGLVVWESNTPLPPGPEPLTECGVAYPGQGFVAGASLRSCDGRFELTLQPQGNLVLTQQNVGAIWESASAGNAASHAIMQTDGNFVVYSTLRQPLWASNTFGFERAYLRVQDDGNLAVNDSNGLPIWETQTGGR